MTQHLLDRPIWDSLVSGHSALAIGNAYAKRFPKEISLFAGAPDNGPESLAALGEMIRQAKEVMLIQTGPIICPDGCVVQQQAEGVQMDYVGSEPQEVDLDGIVPLTQHDTLDMAALAALTKPGPFNERAIELGSFLGIKHEGQLIAMAGERLQHKDHVEVSGVCTHPDFQGKGLARTLSVAATNSVLARGKIPYLHAYASNERAIALYESIGYRLRTRVNAAVLVHSAFI